MSKVLSIKSQAVGLAVVMGLALSACDKEDKTIKLSDYLSWNVTRCERVSTKLIVEFDVTNKSDLTLSDLELQQGGARDNANNDYSFWDRIVNVGFANGGKISYKLNVPFDKQETRKLVAKVSDFDPSNKATKVTITLTGTSAIIGKMDDNTMVLKDVAITDNRIMANGVQTNDTHLDYKVTSCKRDGDNVLMQFTVTNKTGQSLDDFGMGYMYGGEGHAFDRNGNNYAVDVRFGEDDWYHFASSNVTNGETVQGTFRIRNVRNNSTNISVIIGASSKNYEFEDAAISFLTIPITE